MIIKRPDGTTFVVPFQNLHIPTPSVGDIVTLSHEVTARRDVPINPHVYRNRFDLSWKDVVHNYTSNEVNLIGL